MAISKTERRNKIKRRVRGVVRGTATKPRLSVFRSNKGIYVQIINDVDGVTLASASSYEEGVKAEGSKSDIAKAVGSRIAEIAKEKGIETVCFDRNGYLYHGRIKSLAEGAREAGLKF